MVLAETTRVRGHVDCPGPPRIQHGSKSGQVQDKGSDDCVLDVRICRGFGDDGSHEAGYQHEPADGQKRCLRVNRFEVSQKPIKGGLTLTSYELCGRVRSLLQFSVSGSSVISAIIGALLYPERNGRSLGCRRRGDPVRQDRWF
jgi:hypothetical protein